MKIFSVHVIMYTKTDQMDQDEFHTWENVFLFAADSHEDARKKGVQKGLSEQILFDESFKYNDFNAQLVFLGVRKVILADVDENVTRNIIDHIDCIEFTYSSFYIHGYDKLTTFARGGSIMLEIEDDQPTSGDFVGNE